MKRIGILTGGGDAPGLNAVIRAAVKTAIYEYGCEVFGIRDGYDGFIDEKGIIPLGIEDVRGILPRGGTILGAANRGNPYARKVIRDGKEVMIDVSDEIIKGIKQLETGCLACSRRRRDIAHCSRTISKRRAGHRRPQDDR